MRPRNRLVSFLVAWYALYQAVHLLVNLRALVMMDTQGAIDFPAPPPPGGWNRQVISFFIGMASLDAFNAVLAMLFAWGFFCQQRWAPTLGVVALTASIYAALVFDYATWATGAWRLPALPAYLFTNITFLPVVWLFGLLLKNEIFGTGERRT